MEEMNALVAKQSEKEVFFSSAVLSALYFFLYKVIFFPFKVTSAMN